LELTYQKKLVGGYDVFPNLTSNTTLFMTNGSFLYEDYKEDWDGIKKYADMLTLITNANFVRICTIIRQTNGSLRNKINAVRNFLGLALI
jgi:hypothetical protein